MKKFFTTLVAAALLLSLPLQAAAAYSVYTDEAEEPFYFGDNDNTLEQTAGNAILRVGQKVDLNSHIINKDFLEKDRGEEDQWEITSDKAWSSSDERVVTVDSKGVATAQRIGSAKVTVTFWNNFGQQVTQSIRIKVISATATTADFSFTIVENKRIDLGQILLPEADRDQLTWSTSNNAIMTVDSGGIVHALRHGNVTITASYTDASGEVVSQKVTFKIKSALINAPEGEIIISLRQGQTVNLKKLYYPDYTTAATYGAYGCTTSDSSVVTVSGDSITGVGTGSSTVTVGLTSIRSEKDQMDNTQRITVKVIS